MKNLRLEILRFLKWNDGNGTYLDKDQINLGNEPFSLEESKNFLWHTLFSDIINEFTDINALDISYDEAYSLVIKYNLSKLSYAIEEELTESKNLEESYQEILKVVAEEIIARRKFYNLIANALREQTI